MTTKVDGMNPRENQQACKPNLPKYQEQVGWEDGTVQQMCVMFTLRWWSYLMR